MFSKKSELRQFFAKHPRLMGAVFTVSVFASQIVPTGNNGVIS